MRPDREDAMQAVSRRVLLKYAVGLGAGTAASLLKSPAVLAQAAPLKLKFGNDLPITHTVNVRLKEAIEAIGAETKGQVAISLFPNNQLGSDTDMMTQLRSGALELATMPGTVLSTLIPTASLTGVGFAFTDYDKVWPPWMARSASSFAATSRRWVSSRSRPCGTTASARSPAARARSRRRRTSRTSRSACRSCRCGYRCSRPWERLRSASRSTKPIPPCRPGLRMARRI